MLFLNLWRFTALQTVFVTPLPNILKCIPKYSIPANSHIQEKSIKKQLQYFLNEWGNNPSLNNRHLFNVSVYLSVLLWCYVDDKLTPALYGFGVGFWKARRV